MLKRVYRSAGSLFGYLPEGNAKRRLLSGFFRVTGKLPRGGLINHGDSAVMVGSPNAFRLQQFATLTGETGRVLFIEPEPDNQKQLRAAASGYDHVAIDERGAWSEPEVQELLLADSSNPADHKIEVDDVEHDNDYRPENYIDAIEIEVEPLDDILADHGITPDYVEIMVNGAEQEVLHGATETLAGAGPRLLVKGHAREVDTGQPINESIAAFLQEYGYRTVIGAATERTVGDTGEWTKRAGDVYAWKPD